MKSSVILPQQLIYMVQSSPDNGSSLKSAMRLPGLFAWNLHRLSTRSKCITGLSEKPKEADSILATPRRMEIKI